MSASQWHAPIARSRLVSRLIIKSTITWLTSKERKQEGKWKKKSSINFACSFFKVITDLPQLDQVVQADTIMFFPRHFLFKEQIGLWLRMLYSALQNKNVDTMETFEKSNEKDCLVSVRRHPYKVLWFFQQKDFPCFLFYSITYDILFPYILPHISDLLTTISSVSANTQHIKN